MPDNLLADCQKINMDQSTFSLYLQIMGKYQNYCERKELEFLIPSSAEEFFEQVILRLNSYGTQKTYLAAIKFLFHIEGIPLELPQVLIKHKGTQHPRIIPPEDLQKIFHYCSRIDTKVEPFIFYRDQLLFMIIFQSAPKLKHVRNLNVPDLDIEHGVIHYPHQSIPLAQEILPVAEEYLHYRAPEFINHSSALFLNKNRHNRLYNRSIENIFQRFMARAGVPYYTPLNVMETCLYYFLKSFQESETNTDGINFILSLTGKKSTERINNILNLMITEKTDLLLPY